MLTSAVSDSPVLIHIFIYINTYVNIYIYSLSSSNIQYTTNTITTITAVHTIWIQL